MSQKCCPHGISPVWMLINVSGVRHPTTASTPPPPSSQANATSTSAFGPSRYNRPDEFADISSVSQSYQARQQQDRDAWLRGSYSAPYALPPVPLDERNAEAALLSQTKPLFTNGDLRAAATTAFIAAVFLVIQRPCYVRRKDSNAQTPQAISIAKVASYAGLVGATTAAATMLYRLAT